MNDEEFYKGFTEPTLAEKWSTLREWYLSKDDMFYRYILGPELIKVRPFNVPQEPFLGDQGTVDFEDGSYINWDWDNGDFEINGKRLEYPYYINDPLFWPETPQTI